MESIKVKRKVKSSVLRIKELEKFKDRNVLISITPITSFENDDKFEKVKDELLTISVWDESEKDLKVKNWKLPAY